MNKMKQMLLCLLFAVLGQVIFSGCHTAHGFGEDVESAGQSIQNKSGVNQ
jgi:predicted small secreted protein